MHLFTKDLVKGFNLSIPLAAKISHALCTYDDIREACIRRRRAPKERVSLVSLNGVSVDGFLQKNEWIPPFLVYYLVASLRDRAPELRTECKPNGGAEAQAQVLQLLSDGVGEGMKALVRDEMSTNADNSEGRHAVGRR